MTNGIALPSSAQADPRRTLPPGYIHLGVAKEIVPTLRCFGIDPDPVIREAGLDPHLLMMEPTSSRMRLWADCSPCA